MKINYRKNGIGAVIDEYERAAAELKKLIERISDSDYVKIVDTKTKDEDCRSVQTIISHVTNSGYGYANYIRDWFSIPKSSLILSIRLTAIIQIVTFVRVYIKRINVKFSQM